MADIIKDDFIKRSDALLAAFDLYVRDCSALLNNGIPYQHIKNALRTIKAIDVQPVVHGEWIDIFQREDPDTSVECRCSICEKASRRPVGKYCKWCGARMDGGT